MSGRTKVDYEAALRGLSARVGKMRAEALSKRLGITEATLRNSKTRTSQIGAWLNKEGSK